MSTMVAELYDALRKAGVDEPMARDAARAVLGVDVLSDFATKADLAALRADFVELRADVREFQAATRADLAELRSDLIKWNVGAMGVLTAIVAAIVRLG